MTQIEIQLVAVLVALACSLLGTFLVLRKMAMISDAISHSILPGLVIGFFLTHSVNSPWLIVMASLSGMLTVVLVEMISHSNLVKEDTAIGLVFPALFSIGVLLIAQFADDVHLDTDAVLLGELAFAPFDRWQLSGYDIGPKSFWVMLVICLFNLGFIIFFFKELKISTFDNTLAASLGFAPAIIHYGLMLLTSVTTVGAFEAVGAILVVALMIIPSASAYLLSDNLTRILWLACGFGLLAAIGGYWLAYLLDSSIAGAMVTLLGLIFLLVYLFAPKKGVIAFWFRQKAQKRALNLLNFLLDLQQSSTYEQIATKYSRSVQELAEAQGFVTSEDNSLRLSNTGLEVAIQGKAYILYNKTPEINLPKVFRVLQD